MTQDISPASGNSRIKAHLIVAFWFIPCYYRGDDVVGVIVLMFLEFRLK